MNVREFGKAESFLVERILSSYARESFQKETKLYLENKNEEGGMAEVWPFKTQLGEGRENSHLRD